MMKNNCFHDITSEKRNRRSFDEIKHMVRRLESIFETLILMLAYYYIWKTKYRDIPTMPALYGNGKYVLVGVYSILIIVLFYLCDSFQYGHLKLSDVVISQWIAVIIVNLITYFQLCLIANKMIHPLPVVFLTGIDFVLIFILVYIFTAVYHKNYVPRKMLMVYGTKNAVDLKFKMDTRSDKYVISALINVDKGFHAICEEIEDHEAVIINDVPAQIRNDILKYCYQKEIRTYVVPKISDIIVRNADDISLFDTPLFLVKGGGLTITQRFLKRTMDIVLCLIALIPTAPIMMIAALAIKLEDGGPVFYKQQRLTKDGRKFQILKFRSMIVNAESDGYSMEMRAADKDPRITRVGRFIRACRIDELPQILNILKGDMSIVGPRPERVENAAEYSKCIPEFEYRTKVKGGLTGYAQIYGKYNTSAYDKVRLDLMYIENYSILLDIKLIFMTLRVLVKPESTEGFLKEKELEEKRDEILCQKKKSMKNLDEKSYGG